MEAMKFTTAEEVAELVRRFDTWELPKAEWTHEAHLVVGLWYVFHHGAEQATPLVRVGIQQYNESKGVFTTDTSGYHETITLFYLQLMKHYLALHTGERDIVALANALVGSPYAHREYPFEHYSRELLMSVQARRTWVEPDLKPIG